tara:strand:- start:190 stop:534 length:345 start_codon:yes stop_codon:yes gene_type:complete
LKQKNYKSISEVSELLNLEQHVIRYWDSKFKGVSTRFNKRKRRFFSPVNINKLKTLKNLLHTDGKSHHSIETVKKILEDYKINTNKDSPSKDLKDNKKITKLMKVSSNLKKLIE